MNEIERKFLVNNLIEEALIGLTPKRIQQGYLLNSEEKTVRVRTKGEKGYLTIKGKTTGISRSEYEYEIPIQEAEAMLHSFCPSTLIKDRYELNHKNHLWEIDVFHGKLSGLIVAEIELQDEHEHFEKPNWLKEEVSYDPSYFNAKLIERA